MKNDSNLTVCTSTMNNLPKLTKCLDYTRIKNNITCLVLAKRNVGEVVEMENS